jgi:catechol 2,3-dioxygenase-like lactoylglutathione lyase family enzyme
MKRIGRLTLLATILLAAFGVHAAQAPQRPRIIGIGHVALKVSDATAARRFYGEILGLNERAQARDGRLTYAVGAAQYLAIDPRLRAGEDERLAHVAFATPDIRALARYLEARSIPVQTPADRCDETAITVTDPDGHPIEFVESKWPAIATRPKSDREISDRLLHAGLIVRDEQKAHAFYRDILGFGEIWRGGRSEAVTDWVNMRVPDGTDYLEYMLNAATPDRRQRGTAHHICLRVNDIQVAWETVAARHDPAARALLAPPNVGRNGRWQLNLYDADGTRTELMEPFRIR